MKKRFLLALGLAILTVLLLSFGVYATEQTEESNEVIREEIFTYKGYSFGPSGVSVGYQVNLEAMSKYEESLGEDVEIGVVYAAHNSLQGKAPLDENGNPVELDSGMVIKVDLSMFDTEHYDCVLNSISTDELKDIRFVISAYIKGANSICYIQGNGITPFVSGQSYNDMKNGVDGTVTGEGGFDYRISDGQLSVVGFKTEINDNIKSGIFIPASYQGCPVTSIGDSAFKEFGEEFSVSKYANLSSGFVTMFIPTTINKIGDNAFDKCSGLKLELYKAGTSQWVDVAQWDELVQWGTGNKKARDVIWGFRPALGWSRFTDIEIPEGY